MKITRVKSRPLNVHVAYLAAEETGYTAAEVARFLGVKRMSVHQAVIRGKTLRAKFSFMPTPPRPSVAGLTLCNKR